MLYNKNIYDYLVRETKDMTKAHMFFESLKNKRIAVIGAGVSHFDLIKLMLSKGLDVTVCDKATREKFDSKVYDELYDSWRKVYPEQLKLADQKLTKNMWIAPGL